MKSSFFKNLGPISYSDIKEHFESIPINIDEDTYFNEFTSIKNLKVGGLSFLTDTHFDKENIPSDGAIICSQSIHKNFKNDYPLIVVNDLHSAVAKLSSIFYRFLTNSEIEILDKPKIGSNCNISKYAIIDDSCEVGKNCVISRGVEIGKDSIVKNNVVIKNAILGNNVVVCDNSCIGSSGFGFDLKKRGSSNLNPQVGIVIINENVHIGASCTIDRGKLDFTVIGKNSMLDNMVHIAHNVILGDNACIAAQTGISGSVVIGNNVTIGGQVGFAGHIKIGENVVIAARSGVTKNIKDNSVVAGFPATDIKEWKKNIIKQRKNGH